MLYIILYSLQMIAISSENGAKIIEKLMKKSLVRERVFLRKLHYYFSKTIFMEVLLFQIQKQKRCKSKLEKWGENRSKMEPKWFQYLSKIDWTTMQKSSDKWARNLRSPNPSQIILVSAKGRQRDFGHLITWSFWAGGVSRTNWK